MPPPIAAGKRVLLAVAAPAEAKAVAGAFEGTFAASPQGWRVTPLDDRFDMVETGVGKAAAAGAVARVLDTERHGAVLSVGIAGALGAATRIGQVVLADRCDLVDDGVLSPDGFEDLERMGFGPFPGMTNGALTDHALEEWLKPLADVIGPVATVSVCSGTDAGAQRWGGRGYVAEAMEGAAVALVCARTDVPFCELRVISNTTGDRSSQTWDIRGALATLTRVLGRMRSL
ncbi:MAG: futalosine hydrolase [Phycisphaerales bacterium]